MKHQGPVLGCSAFCSSYQNHKTIGRNLDVPFTEGFLLLNLRNQHKKSLAAPTTWTSKYGSLTFNMLGSKLPMGGMNEKGLVFEHLHMRPTSYPPVGNKKAFLEFEWIQYILDTCGSVAEVLDACRKTAIIPGRIGMHFIALDKKGRLVLIEFQEEQMQVHSNEFEAHPVITNDWFLESIRFLQKFKGHGGNKEINFSSRESLDRFAIVSDQIHDNTGEHWAEHQEYVFGVLESVQDMTQLKIIYNPKKQELCFKSSKKQQSRQIQFKDFDFSETGKAMMLDIHEATNQIKDLNEMVINEVAKETILEHNEFLNLKDYLN